MHLPLAPLILLSTAAALYLLLLAWVSFYAFRMGRTWTPLYPTISLTSADDEAIPEHAAAALRSLEHALAALGFTTLGILSIDRPGLFKMLAVIASSADGRTVANASVHIAKSPAASSVPWQVEFWNSLENGTECETVNSLSIPERPGNSSKRITWCREARDPAVLYRLHAAALRTETSRPKPHGLTPENLLSKSRAESIKAIDAALALGGYEVAPDRSLHRMTRMRIARLLAITLPPGGTIRRVLASRHAKPLLLDAGITSQELVRAKAWTPRPAPAP